MRLFISLLLILTITLSVVTSQKNPQKCGANEEINECGGRCELNCGDPVDKPCPLICESPKCVCSKGFRRNQVTGKCVRPSNCPTTQRPTTCGENEIYTTCSSACEPTCGVENQVCPAVCGPPKCECISGYKRNPLNGKCVTPLNCPDLKNELSCGANEIVVDCPPRCEATCDNLNVSCPPVCGIPGCVCAPGYVRTPVSAECVKISECFGNDPSQNCQINEVFNQCSSLCEPTCENQNPTCVKSCGPPKCECITGYVRNTVTGQCIRPPQCPAKPPSKPVCKANEVYNECASPCEPTCENQNPTCVRKCDPPKCECVTGFVRNTKTGDCIRPSQCPRNPPSKPVCKRNEVYVECFTACEPTCENPNPTCVKKCNPPGCECAPGFVRNTRTGECIYLSQCPRVPPNVPVCGGRNEVFNQCSSLCEPTCKNQNPTCVKSCGPPKCECARGFVRNTNTGDCINPSQCSRSPPSTPRCQQNEIYFECSSLCEPSCDNRNPVCALACGPPKCQCKQGFYRNSRNGRCVESRQCPRGSRP
ncbi:Trypsin Inhibitor-like, cysteine rich domain-containing protein [Strongyloides ratti]|uniref:Trypsin Inhibitor-like, cysteine rich domain-containing protein n=1 Tax=Strongyloides ratti TaxID=34506 RepID=A0A090LPQ4_STRRB|nr:Trypsin Inhibitor-like, cysteine rich domain-containing protein [Strongyloides ratti]CEF69530.1 Trypsin Inhibitor-like, cysteine rich domain-containing protein [Strongyloides ratti]